MQTLPCCASVLQLVLENMLGLTTLSRISQRAQSCAAMAAKSNTNLQVKTQKCYTRWTLARQGEETTKAATDTPGRTTESSIAEPGRKDANEGQAYEQRNRLGSCECRQVLMLQVVRLQVEESWPSKHNRSSAKRADQLLDISKERDARRGKAAKAKKGEVDE
eukprot:348636-Pleurochrysis_carterae.AAC.1